MTNPIKNLELDLTSLTKLHKIRMMKLNFALEAETFPVHLQDAGFSSPVSLDINEEQLNFSRETRRVKQAIRDLQQTI